MGKAILVTYDTRSGSTAEVARFIGDTLTDAGAEVTIKPVADMEKIEVYDAVFIGSPIINGKCMKGIKEFIGINSTVLGHKTLAFFITCMRLSQAAGEPLPSVPILVDPVFGGPKPKNEMSFPEKFHPVTMYMKTIMDMSEDIRPISVSFFKGVLDYSKIGFFWTLFFKLMARWDGVGQGDYRNWDAIRLWTQQTHSGM